MSNRLADLESTLVAPRKKAKPAAGTRPKSVEAPPRRPQGALQRLAAPLPEPTLVKGLGELVNRWPVRAAQRMQALGAVDYRVPGLFSPLAQPSSMACWATVYTMLLSWRRQQSLSIEDALSQTGQRWLDLYRGNGGLPGAEHGAFFTAAGLVAEPLQSFSVDGWERLLRDYGPLIVTGNEAPGRAWAMHARVITGIRGDGSAENTAFTIVDPSGGRTYQESIATFLPKFEDEMRRTGDSRLQVAHWSADARAEMRAQSFGRRTVRPRALAAPAVLPIVSAIVGASMTRILNNSGDVSWELDQLQGLKHVDNNAANAGATSYQDKTVAINGPHAWLGGGLDHIYVDTEISFQHNGRSLGNVQIAVVHSNDALGAALEVKAQIMDDANAYSRPPATDRFAAIKVRIHYRFSFTVGGDYIWIDDITLYGDGTHARRQRKTQ